MKNKRTVKVIVGTMLAGAALVSPTVSSLDNNTTNVVRAAQAGTWIKSSDGRWWYKYQDGTYPTNWAQISGKWYFFDKDGWMQTGWINPYGNTYFYLNPGGDMVTGWKNISGTWYYFDNNGYMMRGWQYVSNGWYYLADSGAMQTGFITVNGEEFYLNSSGLMLTGWQVINDQTYFFDYRGAKQNLTNSTRRALVLGETSTSAVPIEDVTAMTNLFNYTTIGGKRFSNVEFYPNRTKEQIEDKFKEMFTNSQDSDVNYLYMTCHGGEYGTIYIASDGGFTGAELRNELSQYKGKFVVLIDCCHAGMAIDKAAEEDNIAQLFVNSFFNNENLNKAGELANAKFSVLCASNKNQLSRGGSISLATKYWARGAGWDAINNYQLNLAADENSNNEVTLAELYRYSKNNVAYENSSQTVVAYPENDNLVIFGN